MKCARERYFECSVHFSTFIALYSRFYPSPSRNLSLLISPGSPKVGPLDDLFQKRENLRWHKMPLRFDELDS